jgi:hypothetical protein
VGLFRAVMVASYTKSSTTVTGTLELGCEIPKVQKSLGMTGRKEGGGGGRARAGSKKRFVAFRIRID